MHKITDTELLDVQLAQTMERFEAKLERAAELESLKRKELLVAAEVEMLYNFKVATLETWRCRGGGPDFIKVGASVYYTHEGVKRFISERLVLGHA